MVMSQRIRKAVEKVDQKLRVIRDENDDVLGAG
jgi:hypothetical protein